MRWWDYQGPGTRSPESSILKRIPREDGMRGESDPLKRGRLVTRGLSNIELVMYEKYKISNYLL